MSEKEAYLGVRKQTGYIQPKVAPSKEQWFHPEQENYEAPSQEQCCPRGGTSEQGHRLATSKEQIHLEKLIGFGDSDRLPGAVQDQQEPAIHPLFRDNIGGIKVGPEAIKYDKLRPFGGGFVLS